MVVSFGWFDKTPLVSEKWWCFFFVATNQPTPPPPKKKQKISWWWTFPRGFVWMSSWDFLSPRLASTHSGFWSPPEFRSSGGACRPAKDGPFPYDDCQVGRGKVSWWMFAKSFFYVLFTRNYIPCFFLKPQMGGWKSWQKLLRTE